MELFKNGYVVAKLNVNDKAYDAWPLADLPNDKTAEALTDRADNEWFCKYDMQHIVPDLDYARIYLNYCKSIKLPVKMLLFESLDSTITLTMKCVLRNLWGLIALQLSIILICNLKKMSLK